MPSGWNLVRLLVIEGMLRTENTCQVWLRHNGPDPWPWFIALRPSRMSLLQRVPERVSRLRLDALVLPRNKV